MTDKQWNDLLHVIRGKTLKPLPAGFIIDSPWLPNWYGITILDYFTNDNLWFKANLEVVKSFPDTMFLPGFWSEYGMCTEPSAFGTRCSFHPNAFPHAYKVIFSSSQIDDLPIPDPRTDGLLPFVLNRLKIAQPKIEDAGHRIRFAVARGPLNIASHLIGTTEFLTMMMLEPDKTHILLKKITTFLKGWLMLQMETLSSVDGIFILDDIIGFIGEPEFRAFALPYLKELFDMKVSVKFLHNDAPCKVSAPFLTEMGVNLFNMGFEVSLGELKKTTQNKVVLLGNIPPRDVLADGTTEDIKNKTLGILNSLEDKSRIIFSCGGGIPPGVKSENIEAFLEAVKNYQ